VIGPVLPEVEYERFSNPPLRAMLGQVQFPTLLRLQKGPVEVADLQDAIRDVFPHFGVEQQIQIRVGPDGQANERIEAFAAFRFGTADGLWSAILTPTFLTVEAAAAGGDYSSFDEFSALFRTVWGAVVEHLRPAKVTQQGLRYIDHIEGTHTPAEWAKWINPALLGPLLTDELGIGAEHAISELKYPQLDGRLDFRHGIATAGPEAVPGYLLDYDVIRHGSFDAADVEGIMSRFDEAHTLVYRFFRWCVTDAAIEEFRSANA
jgi:uncharacterized protein (TIGR04255 family)